MEVAIGIDTHKGSLAAAAVDALGRVLGVREFTNDPTGHRLLLRWVSEQGQPRTVGIEGSLSYGSAAARALLAHGEDVREVAPSLTHLERRRRSKGKSDPVDAVAIARVVAAMRPCPRPGARRCSRTSSCSWTTATSWFTPEPRSPTASTPTWWSSDPVTSRWCRTCVRSGTDQSPLPHQPGSLRAGRARAPAPWRDPAA